jgi:putative membrane protein
MCQGGAVSGRRPHLVVAGVTLAAMVAYPLCGPAGRRRSTSLVVGGLAITTAAGAARTWGIARTSVAAVTCVLGTGVVEAVGVRTGRPFGGYEYTDRLRPQVAGVPVVVPVAWWSMVVPAREAAHAALGAGSTPIRRIGLGALSLAAWDLFLDPQMIRDDAWRWQHAGRYRTVPVSNFLGWVVVGAAAMAVVEVLLPPRAPSSALVAEYGGMAVMETAAFATFFRDRLVAAVGGTAMLPIAVVATARLVGHRT